VKLQSLNYSNGRVVLCLTKYHAMNTYGGVKLKLHVFLNCSLNWFKWSALRPCCFALAERPPAPTG